MAVWLITGTSSGFGREIALAALARGDKVVAAARKIPSVQDLVDKGAFPLALDVTASEADIKTAIDTAVEKFGTIDILVNNAGQSIIGVVEEMSEQEFRDLFNVNFFGHFNVTRAVLPHMRRQNSGAIGFIGSGAGWISYPAASAYCGSKFALAGLATSLREEVKLFNIKVTIIEPGYFKTEMLQKGGEGKAGAPIAKNRIDAYKPLTDPMIEGLGQLAGNQPGDAVKGAKVIVDALKGEGAFEGKEVPPRLVLGTEILEQVEGTIEGWKKSLDEWREVANSTERDDK
ncbi:3-oxoacyl-reductase [Tricladium varicosporioides]|nr:3-oxoacyl-reductase [Hymenoscyphus varicosporioides]